MGAVALAKSIRLHCPRSAHHLVALAVGSEVQGDKHLHRHFDRVIPIDHVTNVHPEWIRESQTLEPNRFESTFTKLRALALTEYDRVLLLDADVLVLSAAVDDLFVGVVPPAGVMDPNPTLVSSSKSTDREAFWALVDREDRELAVGESVSPAYQSSDARSVNGGLLLLQPSCEQLADMLSILAGPVPPCYRVYNWHTHQLTEPLLTDQHFLTVYYAKQWHCLPIWFNFPVMRWIPERHARVHVLHFYGLSCELAKPWRNLELAAGDSEAPFRSPYRLWLEIYSKSIEK